MTTSVYLLGEPGVGRSTVMGELLTPWSVGPAVVLRGDLVGEPFGDRDRIRGIHLGQSAGHRSGTETLPGSALADAVAGAHLTRARPRWVLGEGARLAHHRFLAALSTRGPLLVVHLTASPRVCASRRAAVNAALGRPALADGVVRTIHAQAVRVARAAQLLDGATVITVDTERMTPAECAEAITLVAEAL